jgi:hypothetical protein
MSYRGKTAVCSQIHTKHIHTLWGQKVELVNVKPGGTYSDHWSELYIKTHYVPRSKQMPSLFYITISIGNIFLLNNFIFLKAYTLWVNGEEYCRTGQATDNVAHAPCWIPKTKTCPIPKAKNTHSHYVMTEVKQSYYRPGQSLWVPGVWGSQI